MTPRAAAAALAIALAGICPYAYVLGAAPESRDAVVWILRTLPGRERGWEWVFLHDHFVGYRPVTALTFALEGFLWPHVAAYRASDLAVHALVVALTPWTLGRLAPGAPPAAGLGAAALVALHPAVGLVVPHLARRSYPLSTALALLGLGLLWGEGRGRRLAALPLGLAALAHESGFVAVAVGLAGVALRERERFRPGLAEGLVAGVAASALAARTAVLKGLGGYESAPAGALEVARAWVGGLLATETQRTGAELPEGAAVALAALAASSLAVPWALRRSPHGAAAATAAAWVLGTVAVSASQGVYFPRQLYVALPGLAWLVALAAVQVRDLGPRGLAFAPGLAAALAGTLLQSPVLWGPDPVQRACWLAGTRVLADATRDLAALPEGAAVQLVLPYWRRPRVESIRIHDEEESKLSGRHTATWIRRFTEAEVVEPTVFYRADAGGDAPALRVEGDALRLAPGSSADAVGPDGALAVPPPVSPVGWRYVHDGVRGVLTPVP